MGARRPPLHAPGRCARRDRRRRRGGRWRRPTSPGPASGAPGRSTCRRRRSPSATTVRTFADSLAGLDKAAQRAKLVETGYAMPHWPAPWGRDAGAVEQLVIQQEFERAGIERPALGITAWVILTLIQHATDDQVARWVRPAAQPGRHLVPAVQRARCGLRRRRHQDPWHARRRWLARQRAEGVDEPGPRRQARPGDGAHQPRRAEAQRHHDDGHRHGGRGRRGASAEDGHRHVGLQRGLLQRRVRSRRRRRRPGRRRVDRRQGDARQRERQHRGRVGGDDDVRRRAASPCSTPIPSGSPADRAGSAATSPTTRRSPCSTCAAPTAPSPAASRGRRATSPSWCCRRSATRRRRSPPS